MAKNKPRKQFINAGTSKFILMVLLSVSAGFVGGYYGAENNKSESSLTVTREIIEGEANLVNTIATDVGPSVVSVNVTSVSFGQDFFGLNRSFESESAGTGFIISEDGLILTNRHVVARGLESVTVTLEDGTELEAEVVGRTNESDPLDIAFLKIVDLGDNEITAVNLGDSDQVKVGDKVVAIGNALGQFQNSVTSGIISGFGRDIEAYDGGGVGKLQNLFQTDAAINTGNSGGPLVNSASEVIGINVATASAENISFAIPVNDVKKLIDIVLEKGRLERPFLGVRYVPVNPDNYESLDLDVEWGAYVPEDNGFNKPILQDSPAEKAGIQPGDLIVEIAGQKLDEDNTLVSILGAKQVGDEVELVILRGGEEVRLYATLDSAPEDL